MFGVWAAEVFTADVAVTEAEADVADRDVAYELMSRFLLRLRRCDAGRSLRLRLRRRAAVGPRRQRDAPRDALLYALVAEEAPEPEKLVPDVVPEEPPDGLERLLLVALCVWESDERPWPCSAGGSSSDSEEL